MNPIVLRFALYWLLALLALGVVVILRARTRVQGILVFDFLNLIVIASLLIVSYIEGVTWYLDVALVIALLSLTATVALAKARVARRMF